MYLDFEIGIAVSIIVVILSLIMWAILANEFHTAACAKGFNSQRYFWLPFLFGVFGAMVVIALPNKNERNRTNSKPVPKKPVNDDLPDL